MKREGARRKAAMGPGYPDMPGYDPTIQAMAGYMELTGERDGPPMLCGVPLIDLKAGDEVYGEVMAALLERYESGSGRAIHTFQRTADRLPLPA